MVPISGGPLSAVAAPADVFRAGQSEWERMGGMSADSPLVGAGGQMPYDIDSAKNRIVTGVGDPDIASRQFDDWRDVINWRDSPVFWVLLFSIIVLGLIQLSLSAKVGPLRAAASVGK